MFNSRMLTIIFGITFVLVGVLGFIPNPLVYAEGVFATNAAHNLVHVATGGIFLLATVFPGKENKVIITIGSGYVLVSLLGFLTSGDYLLGLIHINQADRWLHLFLAVAILAAGKIGSNFDSKDVGSTAPST